MVSDMKKIIIAAVASLALVFAAPTMAQNVSPNSNIAIVPMPGMLTACMPISAADEMMKAGEFSPIIRGDVSFVHSDAKIRPSNEEGTRVTIWYSSKKKEIVNYLWSSKRGIACLTHTMSNVTIDESAWQEVGRQANMVDNED